MSFTSPLSYSYGLNVKLKYIETNTAIDDLFPSVEDLIVQSKQFDTFEAAVSSAKGLVIDITAHLNDAFEKPMYKNITELNPKISGLATVSKEWAKHEIAKLWIIPESANIEGGTAIAALGLAQIVAVEAAPVMVS